MAVKGFLMHLGYVESSSTLILFFQHNRGFDTAEAALHSLRKCFVDGYERTHSNTDHEFFGNGSYCGGCGKLKNSHIKFEWDFNNPQYQDLIEEEVRIWSSGDADSTSTMWEILESAGWATYIGDLQSLDGIVIIEQQGECCISMARIV